MEAENHPGILQFPSPQTPETDMKHDLTSAVRRSVKSMGSFVSYTPTVKDEAGHLVHIPYAATLLGQYVLPLQNV